MHRPPLKQDAQSATVALEIAIDSRDDLRALRGALLASRASELSELQRRAGRHSYGYGTDSARDSMGAEVVELRRRIEMLDRLLAAVETATGSSGRPARGPEPR